MKNTLILYYSLCLSIICGPASIRKVQVNPGSYDQARQTALQDFSKTRLYKDDSVFLISIEDTLHRLKLKKIDERQYKWVHGTIYPEIVVITISAYPNKFFLDTTTDVSAQTKYIPSRSIELNGKLFFWFDKYYTLTNNAIKIMDKYNRIRRGGPNDAEDMYFMIDDAKKAADYYFCRSNLSVYKRVITNIATGYYDPPNVKCKQ